MEGGGEDMGAGDVSDGEYDDFRADIEASSWHPADVMSESSADAGTLAPRCWDCGTPFREGDGYGETQVFCSETCADSYRHGLGA